MKLVTWNVNSAKTLKNYHPFLNLSFAEILNSFGAEIICLQEIKSSQLDLAEEYHTLNDYYCFYNLNSKGSNGIDLLKFRGWNICQKRILSSKGRNWFLKRRSGLYGGFKQGFFPK